ncbi:MAG: hypothetical protein SFU98_17000 [Leptospiraceae bacterium]|nr:hypothetical protein [Leptospiraceae bacterium]
MKKILVECYGDEALVKYLGISDIEHCYGSGNVLNKLKNRNDGIGLIDADPIGTKNNYFKAFKQIGEANYGVSIHIDYARSNKIIMIDPQLEGWLWKLFEEINSKKILKKHRFPENQKDLHTYLGVNKSNNLIPLLSEIEVNQKSNRLEELRRAL